MYCRNCGTDVTNMKYCPKCGTCVDPSEDRSPPFENTQAQKVLTISQLKWFCFSVVLTAWGLLFISADLLPYVMAHIRYTFDDYELFTYIYPIMYFAVSAFLMIKFHKGLKSSGYMETSQYKFSKVLALNKANLCQIVIFAFIIWYAIIGGRDITNGTAWRIAVIILAVGCVIWLSWFLAIKKVRTEDKKMVIVALYVSFREYWISMIFFIIGELLLSMIASILPAFSVVMLIALMFAYPVIRVTMTKPVLKNVYKVK